MFTTLINLVLLLIGAIAALAAFNGETGLRFVDKHLKKSMSRRISLTCVVLAVGFGIAKEVHVRSEEKIKDAAAARASADATVEAEKRQSALEQELVDCRRDNISSVTCV